MRDESSPLVRPGDPGALGDLVRAARQDALDDRAMAKLAANLASAGIATTGAIATGAAAKPASLLAKLLGASTTTKVGIATVALAIAAAGGIAALRSTPHPQVATAAPMPAQVEAARGPEPIAEVPASALPASSAEMEPAPLPPVTTAKRLGARSASPAPARSAPAAPLGNEGALLLQARALLASDPARALSLVETHAQTFPNSQLAPERARIAAEARARIAEQEEPASP